MDEITKQNKVMDKHSKSKDGIKTVCVSTCLNYLGIPPKAYRHTQATPMFNGKRKFIHTWRWTLRVHGYTLKDLWDGYKTMNKAKVLQQCRQQCPVGSMAMIIGSNKGSAHMFLADSRGKVIIDTAPRSRFKRFKLVILCKA